MGAAESTEASSNPVNESSPTNEQQSTAPSDASSFLNDPNVELAVAKAYEEGRIEGIKSQQEAIAQAAFNTYDHAYRELNDLQDKKLREVAQLDSRVGSRLPASVPVSLTCTAEQSELQTCLVSNKSNSVACRDFVLKYSACANINSQVQAPLNDSNSVSYVTYEYCQL